MVIADKRSSEVGAEDPNTTTATKTLAAAAVTGVVASFFAASLGIFLAAQCSYAFLFSATYAPSVLYVPDTHVALHAWGAFLVYAAFSIVGGVWMYYYLPETKNLSLEAIESLFKDPYPAPMRGQQVAAAAAAKVETKPKESSSLLPK